MALDVSKAVTPAAMTLAVAAAALAAVMAFATEGEFDVSEKTPDAKSPAEAVEGPIEGAAASEEAPVTEVSETSDDAAAVCPVIESRDWAAWVNAMPGPDSVPTLHVSGMATLPTPGYRAEWRVGPADRRLPPAQTLELTLTAPDGFVAQVLSETELRFEAPATYPEYRAVVVRCGGVVLAEIDEVTVAQ
ncbi:MAG: hypothetical protein AAF909_10545 [Pseudomonadota bacterium]